VVFNEKGVRLLTEGLEQPMPMFGDAGRLEQVITNLLQNAVRFTPKGKCVWFRASRTPAGAVLQVVDEGQGIEPGDLRTIFGMFAQSRQGLARTEGGLGLGLTIAERIIAAHGGTIEAHSEGPGRGATFTVTLPLDERAIRNVDEDGVPRTNLRIVVVEDQDDAREALEMLLDMEGHEVSTARDGPEGLELILDRHPQVALLDIGLPKMNGYELAAAVRERLGNRIKLVAMSGYGQPDDVRNAEIAGFDRHLTKPVDPRRLASALREINSRDSTAPASARAAAKPAG
jgi:CheY-like chemotaxis protein